MMAVNMYFKKRVYLDGTHLFWRWEDT
jgi:hypothetical protein